MATAAFNGGDLVNASLHAIVFVVGSRMQVSKSADSLEIFVYYRDDCAPDAWLEHCKAWRFVLFHRLVSTPAVCTPAVCVSATFDILYVRLFRD